MDRLHEDTPPTTEAVLSGYLTQMVCLGCPSVLGQMGQDRSSVRTAHPARSARQDFPSHRNRAPLINHNRTIILDSTDLSKVVVVIIVGTRVGLDVELKYLIGSIRRICYAIISLEAV